LETIANPSTPLAFFPMPKSSTLLVAKKSELEKRRLEESACWPVELVVSKAMQ
jgi:hypothetical protein